jgi:RND family efflux transporter MFP subunit
MSDIEENRSPKSLLRLEILAPILVLVVGALSAKALIDSRQAPPREARAAVGPLVEVMEARSRDLRVTVSGEGEVSPRISVELLPEVAGRVVKVHPELVAGGRFRTGEVLVRIDPREYELAVERSRAAVARAQVSIEREQAEADAARAEWRELHGDEPAPTLLAREPQIRQAEAELAAAEADLASAQLALDHTTLTLPFDGIVISENVDPGQFISQGRAVAQVYGTDAAEIRVPLDDSEIAWLDDFRADKGKAPRATVHAELFGEPHTWAARVDRLEGRVDPKSRMMHLVVRVDDPFDGPAPLLAGTFVDVEIEGRSLEGIFEIPRYALRADDRIWVVKDDTLHIREAEVIRRDRHHVYIGQGLDDGEQIVTSSLDVATDGMAVRVRQSGEGASQ